KELESFSYSVSHDLRAPLRAINGFTQVLLEDYIEQLGEDAKSLLNEVITNSDKMGELIDNLLAFSRIGKQHVSKGDINVNQLVSVVIAEQKQLEPKRIVDLTIKKLENIRGDRSMVKQVFVNLVSNAFKYTSKKKNAVIEIGSYLENDDCVYYVKDNGAGFDMDYYDKLFGVFQRLHSSHEFDGTGVGLAIVQKIITKHHGKVWAEGKVGEGACFYISLPIK
ncbi:MAG: ATP-binding protein, partial [Ferruginibacter sp.]